MRTAFRKAVSWGIDAADRALSAVSDAAGNAWVAILLAGSAAAGQIGAAAGKLRALAMRTLRFIRILALAVSVVVCLDWGTKIAVNAVIPPVPNSRNLVPLDPRDYTGRFFLIAGDDAFAITHVEHAYTSANDKWLDSPYASPALDTQAWLLEQARVEFDLWVVALAIMIFGTLAVAVAVGTLFRMPPFLIAVLAGVYIGGAIGNSVELGFLNDVTDWIWVSLGNDSAIIFNLADVAIVLALLVYLIWPALGILVLICWILARICGSAFRVLRRR